MIKITRLASGIYDVTVEGRLFEIERDDHGQWQLVEIVNDSRDYWNHFATFRAAKDAIVAGTAPKGLRAPQHILDLVASLRK